MKKTIKELEAMDKESLIVHADILQDTLDACFDMAWKRSAHFAKQANELQDKLQLIHKRIRTEIDLFDAQIDALDALTTLSQEDAKALDLCTLQKHTLLMLLDDLEGNGLFND